MKYLNIKILLLILFVFTGITNSFAQYPSDNGQFEVNVLQGCAPLFVEITNPCTNCADYDFNNDGNGDGINFTYESSGTFTIEAFAAGGTITDQVTINVHQDTIPQFNIYRCGGRNIEVRINDDNYDSYRIEWGDGNSTTISGTDKEELHSYGTGGNKTVTVTGLHDSGAGNCTPNAQTVADVENLPVATIDEVGPIDNQTDKVYIKYTANPNALYKLQLSINGTGNWIPAQDISPDKDSIVVSSLLLESNFYCFRIATLNACLGGNPPEAFSSVVCTQVFNVNFTNNEENILNWSTNHTDAESYTVIKESDNTTNIQLNDETRRSYTDQQVTCNTNYCYVLITNYPSGAIVRSIQKCGTATLITTPPPVNNIVTQVNDDQIDITWEAPATSVAESYNLFRSVNDGLFDVAANELTTTEYVDSGLEPAANSYCYEINYKDRCQNVSQMSREVCALRLRGGAATIKVIRLNWNAYNGYSAGVSGYLLEKFNSNGALLGSFTLSGTSFSDTLDINDPQQLMYRVTAIPNDNSFENAISNFISVIRQGIFAAPNAFIPGSSGENSVFKIVSPFIAEIDLRIFNRWGEMVFHTTDPDSGWPGTDQNGNPLPQGTYVFQALMISEAGEESEAFGSVLLIRK